jgi:DNA polymerase
MSDHAEKLAGVRAACESCQRCALGATRTNLVFGTGSPDARLMFIGEAPGEREDATGIPFVGAAGQLLDRYLFAVGIPREDVYIANILKCRPPQNRDPLPSEEAACIDYLRCQVELLQPRVIVCLGRISAMKLIKEDFRITKEHGVWFEKDGQLMTAVYHPAYLLRDPRKRTDMMEDMKRIAEKLNELRGKV